VSLLNPESTESGTLNDKHPPALRVAECSTQLLGSHSVPRAFFPRIRLIREADLAKGGEPSRKIRSGSKYQVREVRVPIFRGTRQRLHNNETSQRQRVSQERSRTQDFPRRSLLQHRASGRSMGLLEEIERLIENNTRRGKNISYNRDVKKFSRDNAIIGIAFHRVLAYREALVLKIYQSSIVVSPKYDFTSCLARRRPIDIDFQF